MSSLFDLIVKRLYNDGEMESDMATDKRILKTKASIKTAFMQLALDSHATKITVSDVADRAQINRSTFYLHYNDVSAVRHDIHRELADKMSASIERFDIADSYGSIYSILTTLADLLDGNETVKNYMIFSSDSESTIGWLKHIFVERTAAEIEQSFPRMTKERTAYPLTFVGAGILDCYVKWVRSHGNGIPSEELIREMSGIVNYVISGITSGHEEHLE